MRLDEIPTPPLVLDLAALRQNVAVMSQFAKARSISLRPHAKSHKVRRDRPATIRCGRAWSVLRHHRRGRGVGGRRSAGVADHIANGDP